MRTPARITLAVVAAALAFSLTPASVATPAACEGRCEVAALSAGYLTPITEISRGARVVWNGLDTSHPTSEIPAEGKVSCFSVAVGPGVKQDPVKFTVKKGAVKATVAPGTKRAVKRTCHGATLLPTGDRMVTYRCEIHPHMLGALVISA